MESVVHWSGHSGNAGSVLRSECLCCAAGRYLWQRASEFDNRPWSCATSFIVAQGHGSLRESQPSISCGVLQCAQPCKLWYAQFGRLLISIIGILANRWCDYVHLNRFTANTTWTEAPVLNPTDSKHAARCVSTGLRVTFILLTAACPEWAYAYLPFATPLMSEYAASVEGLRLPLVPAISRLWSR